jgi:glycosyltransferase involved in cell wall biosynthesis
MTDELPLVSIVTPSLNQGEWIEDAVTSVLGQDYPRIEYVVMDGGSTDGTLALLRRYEKQLTWTSGPDGGQARALRTGFERTHGEILGWLNADDAYAPGAVARAVAAFLAEPDLGLAYGDADFMDAKGRPLGTAAHVVPLDDMNPLLRLGDCVVQPAAFFRRPAYDAVGGINPELHWAMDYDLWLRLARGFRSRHLGSILAYVRCTPTTKTSSGGWQRLAEVETVLRRGGANGLPAWFELEATALHVSDALTAVRKARVGNAVSSAFAALRALLRPRTLAVLASPRTWRIASQRRRNSR